MTEEFGPRKLAAIMSIDVAGYSAMTETDEAHAVELVARLREMLHQVAQARSGRIFNTAGDGFMLEFASAADALAAAEHVCGGVERKSIRVGVHIGDVLISQNGDLLGHSVNVTARLQQLAQPGDVVVSTDVRRAVRGKLAQRLHPAGAVQLDKMSEALEIFTLEAIAAPKPRGKRLEPMLAVLPFDNESDDPQMNYFSEGVADEIIMTLLRQSKIKVIGRTSAFQFRGERKTEAAHALKATHVLDGSVRCAGTKLRVNAQLIEASSGMALWSERFDGDRADAFALEDEIALKVAASLRRSLAQSERAAHPINPAAYDLYLRARQIWLMLSDVEEDQAEVLLERCVALAPDFPDAWAALASVRAFLLPRHRDMIGEPQHDAAVAAAERALALDPDCAQAFAALSLLKPAFGAHGEKLRLVDEALKRTPNDASLHVARSAWLYGVGRLKDAAAALETASRLDPLGPAVEGLRASLMSARGEADTALEIMQAAWARWPDSPFIWYLMWSTDCAAGRVDEAEALAAPGVAPKRAVTERDISVLRNYAAMLRLAPDERRHACERVLAQAAQGDGPLALSTILFVAAHGCVESALDALEAAIDAGRDLRPDNHDGFGMARAQSPLQLFVSNGGTPIWKHKRFPRLAARLGLAQYWIESDRWPDCATEVDYDFRAECRAAMAPPA
ncbi:MAG TPA: adenylate/guanylate cyclase domain-containing protein [Vitreimonas sp.]|uniref:adenylate/guanylate cyclase domain-containing protein n=1 Tax=Vitreimonas sp. TaxID=3069702 RepID=UPI002D2B82D0|nr:adenylate/guanylate cyclase domain-containing protein [Vitreimonas sp.]HYD88372.1 adenylate/guanylate cyclase domain-containing protein [Vitreimonas sp.]